MATRRSGRRWTPATLRAMRFAGIARPAALIALVVGSVACAPGSGPAGPSAPASSPTPRPTATASPTPAAYEAAIERFVALATGGELSYRISYRGDARASADVLPVTGTLDVSGADFASSMTYDFSEEYQGLGSFKVQVRGVGDEGWIKRPGKLWTAIKGYGPHHSAVPFKAVEDVGDVTYLGPDSVDGRTVHRISVPGAVLIHPNTIPFDIVKEKVDSTTLEVAIDDDGLPHTGAWSLRGQARVGFGVGQLQRIIYELDLVFSKVGDEITIERP